MFEGGTEVPFALKFVSETLVSKMHSYSQITSFFLFRKVGFFFLKIMCTIDFYEKKSPQFFLKFARVHFVTVIRPPCLKSRTPN